ncbi:MAG: 50S ribosomal protein L25 [Anaerolineales bacterium]|nr:50S ribosomal protein L25 [Anaerolineales bacterium]MDW8278131.1 50S ribosomal protein L25 [Anaerolineales bacterium]
MEKVVLKATKRTVTGKQVKQLRRKGLLPGVIYGHNMEPTPISLDAHDASLILPKLTSSSIVTIDLEGKQIAALVREKQRNFIKNFFTHVDFQAVSLTEAIRTYVSLHFSGAAPAVKDFQAIVVTNLAEIEVEALPADLPERIEVDLSKLAAIGDAIYVKDLVVPAGVEVLTDGDEVVVVATGATEEKEETEIVEGIEPELSVERGKKEEEE